MLDFPGVLIRTSTERPEVLDKGTVVIGGIDGRSVVDAVNLCVAMFENKEPVAPVPDYTDANVSVKVVKIIESYVKIVNDVIWKKR